MLKVKSQHVTHFASGWISIGPSFSTVGALFKDCALIGCLFHFKQAARRKMMRFDIATEEIMMAVTHGMYDLLMILPKDELETRGIPFVQTQITKKIGSHYGSSLGEDYFVDPGPWDQKWDEFWVYFCL